MASLRPDGAVLDGGGAVEMRECLRAILRPWPGLPYVPDELDKTVEMHLQMYRSQERGRTSCGFARSAGQMELDAAARARKEGPKDADAAPQQVYRNKSAFRSD